MPQRPRIRNRINRRGVEMVRASDLQANPLNWRTHPSVQVEALRKSLDDIGFVKPVLARWVSDDEPLVLLDGHLRVQTADPSDEIPTLILGDLTDVEANQVLATLDPLGAMAASEQKALKKLIMELDNDDEMRILAANLHGVTESELSEMASGAVTEVLAEITRRPEPLSPENLDLLNKAAGGRPVVVRRPNAYFAIPDPGEYQAEEMNVTNQSMELRPYTENDMLESDDVVELARPNDPNYVVVEETCPNCGLQFVLEG